VSAIRAFLYAPAGRRTKWLVVLFWLILVVVAGPLSGKLTGAEKNDSSSWLPPAAESTQVLNIRSSAISPNVYPGVLVYDRASGITAADKAKAAADAAKLAKIAGAVPGSVGGIVTRTVAMITANPRTMPRIGRASVCPTKRPGDPRPCRSRPAAARRSPPSPPT